VLSFSVESAAADTALTLATARLLAIQTVLIVEVGPMGQMQTLPMQKPTCATATLRNTKVQDQFLCPNGL